MRSLKAALAALAVLGLAGCHTVGHVPPGHGGTPPGQAKKQDD